MLIVELEERYVTRNIPLLGIEEQINVCIQFCRNLAINIEQAKQAIFLDNLAHFAKANLSILIRVIKVKAHIDTNTAANTSRNTSIQFSRRRKTAVERKFIDINTLFVLIRHIEAIE